MKKCIHCQTEIDDKAKVCPQCRREQESSAVRIFFGVVIGLLILGIWGYNYLTSGIDEDKCYITLSEFNRIENGMSYEQVKEIVGCEGTVNSDTEIMETRMTIYSWYGIDGISNANITIQNDKLINKTQIGLK